MTDVEYSEVRRCEHCQNEGAMFVRAFFTDMKEYDSFFCGYQYQVLQCPSCREIIVRRAFEDTGAHPINWGPWSILSPSYVGLSGMPEKVQKAYDSAQRVRRIDPSSFAVQLRRMLEFICQDQQATGKTLADKIKDLSGRNLIPDKLSEIANHLRDFGNVGAHAAEFEITEAEIPILDSLARAIAEYIYAAPMLAKQAEDRFRELKGEKEE